MDYNELEKAFDTEKKCREYIAGLRWKDGFCCPRCQHTSVWITNNQRYKCQYCGYKMSVTAGTIFQDSRTPLPIWFKAIWIVSQNGKVTACKLQKELELKSNRTALAILNKLNQAKVRPTLDRLHGIVEVKTAYMILSTIKATVAIAVEVNGKQIGRIRMREIDRPDADSLNRFVEDVVDKGSAIICRDLNVNNSHYQQAIRPATYEFLFTRKVTDKAEVWLRRSYKQGDLNSYLDEYCTLFNSLKTKITFDELLQNAITAEPSPYVQNIFAGEKKKAP